MSGLKTAVTPSGSDRWLMVAMPLALCMGMAGMVLGGLITVAPLTAPSAANLLGGFVLMHAGAMCGMIAGAAYGTERGVTVALELDVGHDRAITAPALASALLGIIFFPLALLVSAASARILQAMGFGAPETSPLLAYMDPARPVLMLTALACVSIVAPFSEEMFFRLGMHDSLRRLGVRSPAVWVAVVFAVFHGQLFAIPGLFLLSLLLQCVRQRFGTLWSPIVLHGVYNGCAVTTYIVCGGSA